MLDIYKRILEPLRTKVSRICVPDHQIELWKEYFENVIVSSEAEKTVPIEFGMVCGAHLANVLSLCSRIGTFGVVCVEGDSELQVPSELPFDVYHYKPESVTILIKRRPCIYFDSSTGHGLCSIMNKIASAAYYCEKYGYDLMVDRCYSAVTVGYATQQRTRNYLTTIFRRLKVYDSSSSPVHMNALVIPSGDYPAHLTDPSRNLLLEGLNTNCQFFFKMARRGVLSSYFDLDDPEILDYIAEKYNLRNGDINVMVGLRMKCDGAVYRLNKPTYKNAIDTIVKEGKARGRHVTLYVFTDIDEWHYMIDESCDYKLIRVQEDDLTQFYLGMQMNYFIVGESGFYWWMAFLNGVNNRGGVVYTFESIFPDSIVLPDWKLLPLFINTDWLFVPRKDAPYADLGYVGVNKPLGLIQEICKANPLCAAFNTDGFMKSNTTVTIDGFQNEYQGLYVRNR